MTCSQCGRPVSEGCSCMGQDLMGFLSDFRSATAAKSSPDVERRPRARCAPALEADQADQVDWSPPRAEIPFYSPTETANGRESEPAPVWAPPESDDYPYYTPPAPGPVAQVTPDWAPPTQAGANYWAPPHANGAAPDPPGGYPPAGPIRLPMWAIGAMVAAVAVVAGIAGMFVLKSSPSLSGLTAEQVMAKTIAAAHKAGTFHVEATESQSGQVVHMSIDVGTAGGSITTLMGAHSADLRVVQGGVYLRGDAVALGQMGFSDSFAEQYAGQWLAIPTTDPNIQQMVQSLDANQIIDRFLHLSGPLTRVATGQGGGVTLQGTVPDNQFNQGSGAGDTANLVVSDKEPFVPVSISFSDPDNGSTQMTFSHWGERVPLTVPPNAVALPPGGGS
jgi:hypothetical protein